MTTSGYELSDTVWMLAVRAHLETMPAPKQQWKREVEETVAALNEQRSINGDLPVAVPTDDEVVAYIGRLISVGTEMVDHPVL